MSPALPPSPPSPESPRSPGTPAESSADSLGSPVSPAPSDQLRSQAQAQVGGQRDHYGPLWFVQVTANHNSIGHAVVPAPARRTGLAIKGVAAASSGCPSSVSSPPPPMAERERPRAGIGQGLGSTGPIGPLGPRPHHVSGRIKRKTLQLLALDRTIKRASSGVATAKTNNSLNHGAANYKPQPPVTPPPPRTERRSLSSSSSSSSSTNVRKQLHRVESGSGAAGAQVSSSACSPRPHAVPAAHRDSFHGAMCPALIVAQCFALLPVDGISLTHPGAPQFRWLSFRVCYTVAVFTGTGVVALLAAYRMVSAGLSFNSSVTVVFFGNSLSAMVLFLQLATRWPAVARAWARIEHDMRAYGYPRHLGRKVKIMTAIVLLLAAVEHLLAVMTAVYTSWPCYESGGLPGLLRGYSINNFAMVLQVTEYTPWKAAFVFLLNVVATFSWNYTDLFIMLLSVSLAQRFKQLNHRLRALKGKNLPSGVWRQLRETYNSLACLTRTVDEAVNNIVLLSFASNLYFICVQLLQGMKLILDVYPYVYFFFSFGYLLLRTCVVSLYAASIHDESKEPRRVLYSVPSESFCTEVRRFLAQVTTDEVALTGCNFFSVTRSLMLTVAGTIVTYEIVLVQFQGVSGDGSSDSTTKAANITVRCF